MRKDSYPKRPSEIKKASCQDHLCQGTTRTEGWEKTYGYTDHESKAVLPITLDAPQENRENKGKIAQRDL